MRMDDVGERMRAFSPNGQQKNPEEETGAVMVSKPTDTKP